jgi:nucleoside-diphosphate-sugar epimerase
VKLVITGPLGHIGSRLIHSVTANDVDEVVLVDDLSSQRYCSLFNLLTEVRWKFIQADITSEEVDLERIFAGATAVIHLAAITNAAGSFDNQEQVERVNYYGTQRVASAAAKTRARLVFLSTTSVYGVSEGTVDEGCTPEQLQPQSPYARSKLQAEQFIVELGKTSGLKFFIGRFGTIYGASIGMRFHTAVNKFVWQACMGQPLTVWQTALDQKRPYLDLGDAVRALKFVVAQDLFDNRIYNVLTNNLTVREIIDTIREFVSEVNVELVETQIMNQLSYTVDCSRFRSRGFEFKGDLRTGVGESIAQLKAFAG